MILRLKPINISLAPNYRADDVSLAIRLLSSPLSWFDPKPVEDLEVDFAGLFGSGFKAFALNSGRSAEFVLLKALGIGLGDEVIVQAFTCVAVPNAILWTGAKPVYADIDRTFNLDVEKLTSRITKATKAIIVQHTFGIPAEIEKIRAIAQKHGLLLIEDCSHALGARVDGKLVGTFGDVAFFSFGRDKIISSVFGGMILTADKTIAEKIELLVRSLTNPQARWIAQQLFHPIATYSILPISNSFLGKLLLLLLQKCSLLSRAVYAEEKLAGKPAVFPSKMPGALALLATHQLRKLTAYNNHRLEMAKSYFQLLAPLVSRKLSLPEVLVEKAVWLRVPIIAEAADELIKFARSRGVVLGDWYRPVVMPAADLARVGYLAGSCPQAEALAAKVVNLPTNPNLKLAVARQVVKVIKDFYGS